MLEPALYAMLGFLVAVALAFAIAPSLWRRAEVLERRRLEAALPLTRDELQGEIDAVRADRAMAVRRLEVRLQAAKRKASEDLLTIGTMKTRMADIETELAEQERQLRRTEERHAAYNIDRIAQAAASLEDPHLNDSDGEPFDVDALRLQASAHELEIERQKDIIQEMRVQRREQDRSIRALQDEISKLHSDLEDARAHGAAPAKGEVMPASRASTVQSGTTHGEPVVSQIPVSKAQRLTSTLDWQTPIKPRKKVSAAADVVGAAPEAPVSAPVVAPAEIQMNLHVDEQVNALAERIARPRKSRSAAIRKADQDALRDEISALAARVVNAVANEEGEQSPILQILSTAQDNDASAAAPELNLSLADRVHELRRSADAAE